MSHVTCCAGSQSTLLLVLPSALGMLAICSEAPQVPCSQRRWRRSIGADSLKTGTRITVVTRPDLPWELQKQPRPWPHLCMHVPSKPTAANADQPHPQMSWFDVPQVLSLQRPLLRRQHKSMDYTATVRGLRFHPCFLSGVVPGDQLRFQPCLYIWAMQRHMCTPRALKGGVIPAVSTLRVRLL